MITYNRSKLVTRLQMLQYLFLYCPTRALLLSVSRIVVLFNAKILAVLLQAITDYNAVLGNLGCSMPVCQEYS